MGNICHKLKGFLVCQCFVPVDMDEDHYYNKQQESRLRTTVTCNNKIYTISTSELDDAVIINATSLTDSLLPVGSFGIGKQRPADLSSILSTTLTDIEQFRGSSINGRNLFHQSSSHLAHRRMSDTLSLESGYMSIAGLNSIHSPTNTLPMFNESVCGNSSSNDFPIDIPVMLDQTIQPIVVSSCCSSASNSPVMTLSKRSNSQLDFVMPVFYEWSKSSLNRLTSSMSKFVLIESMKKKMDSKRSKKSANKKTASSSSKPVKSSEVLRDQQSNNTLVCRTVRLFTLANSLFSAYFMRICDPNFL